MPPHRYRGPPMTLANMRAQGVRSLWVVCDLCHHQAVMNVDRFSDAVPVPAFGPRMVWYVVRNSKSPLLRDRFAPRRMSTNQCPHSFGSTCQLPSGPLTKPYCAARSALRKIAL